MDLQNLPGTAAKKLCKACGISKSIFEFSAHPQTKDRLRPKCKSCRRLVYYSSKTKCAVPGCSVKTDKRANCCIPHANIKKAYPDVPDNALDQIDIKHKDLMFNVDNGITLCHNCHIIEHKNNGLL